MAPRIYTYFLPALKAFRVLLTILLACTMLLGCAGGQSPVGRLPGSLPVGSNVPEAPEIFLIRRDFSDYLSMTSNAASHKIVVDNEEVFLIAPWWYTSFHIAQGGHRIGIKFFAGWSDGWKESSLTMQFEANSKYYFKVNQSWQCAGISLIDEAEGLALIKDSRYIPFEYNNPPGSDPSLNYPPNKPSWNIWTGGMN